MKKHKYHCDHCKDTGRIEPDNNGPLGDCILFNPPRGTRHEREWDLAMAQRLRQRIANGVKPTDPL